MRRLAAITVALHAFGLGLAALAMRPGTLAEPLEARAQFLARWPPGWLGGWAVWVACALSLAVFVAAAARRIGGGAARLALAACALGLAIDASCDGVQVWSCALAARGLADPLALPRFVAAARLATIGGASAANGLYTLATILVTVALRRVPAIALTGAALGVAGAAMVAAGPAQVAWPLELSSGATIFCYALWAIAVARHLDRP